MLICIKNKNVRANHTFNPKYSKLRRVEVEKDGRITREVQYCEYDCGESSKGSNPLDFCITNLLAVGAYGNLAPSLMRTATDFSFIDKFETSTISKTK